MDNQYIADRIVALGLNAPKVEFSHVKTLMESITYETVVVPTTYTTIVYAIHKGFIVAEGRAACVSAENFNAELGEEIATTRAKEAAMTELWKLEGWTLHRITPEGAKGNRTEAQAT